MLVRFLQIDRREQLGRAGAGGRTGHQGHRHTRGQEGREAWGGRGTRTAASCPEGEPFPLPPGAGTGASDESPADHSTGPGGGRRGPRTGQGRSGTVWTSRDAGCWATSSLGRTLPVGSAVTSCSVAAHPRPRGRPQVVRRSWPARSPPSVGRAACLLACVSKATRGTRRRWSEPPTPRRSSDVVTSAPCWGRTVPPACDSLPERPAWCTCWHFQEKRVPLRARAGRSDWQPV